MRNASMDRFSAEGRIHPLAHQPLLHRLTDLLTLAEQALCRNRATKSQDLQGGVRGNGLDGFLVSTEAVPTIAGMHASPLTSLLLNSNTRAASSALAPFAETPMNLHNS